MALEGSPSAALGLTKEGFARPSCKLWVPCGPCTRNQNASKHAGHSESPRSWRGPGRIRLLRFVLQGSTSTGTLGCFQGHPIGKPKAHFNNCSDWFHLLEDPRLLAMRPFQATFRRLRESAQGHPCSPTAPFPRSQVQKVAVGNTWPSSFKGPSQGARLGWRLRAEGGGLQRFPKCGEIKKEGKPPETDSVKEKQPQKRGHAVSGFIS